MSRCANFTKLLSTVRGTKHCGNKQRTCNFTFYYGKGSALLNSCEQLEKTHWLLRQSREILTIYTDPLFSFAMRTNLFAKFAKKPRIDQNASVKVLKNTPAPLFKSYLLKGNGLKPFCCARVKHIDSSVAERDHIRVRIPCKHKTANKNNFTSRALSLCF